MAVWFSVKRFIFCVSFRQKIFLLSRNTSFLWPFIEAMLIWFSVRRFILVVCFDKIYLCCHWTHHIYGSATQRYWFNTVSHCMLLVFIKRLWFSVLRFIFCVSFWSNIFLLSLKTSFVRHCIAATLNWRSYKSYVSWIAYKNIIQCQKIYILCFVSTKYISVDTEYIVSTTTY